MLKIKNRVRGNDFHRALLFHSRLTARLARCLEPENQFLLLFAPTNGTTAALIRGCLECQFPQDFLLKVTAPVDRNSFIPHAASKESTGGIA